MSKKPTVRFAFTIQDEGLTSGVIRVWSHGEDVYVAPEDISGIWKASFHGDSAWQIAMTKEHTKSGHLPQLPLGADRAQWKFQPTLFEHGIRRMFVVCAVRSALIYGPPDGTAHHLFVEDRWDRAFAVHLWMSDVGVDFRPDVNVLVGSPLPLRSGRMVWLLAGSEAIEGDPEPAAEASFVEPLLPNVHGVSTAGVLLRGLRIA